TVHLDADYDTPDYTVGTGAAGAGPVNLLTGDAVQDGAQTYRYVGAGASLSLTDASIKGDPTDFKAIGGISGDIYTYVGVPGASPINLATTNYNDASNWQRFQNLYVAPAGNSPTRLSSDLTVQLDADYDTPDYTVGAGAAGAGPVNLHTGDVVQDGAQ